MTIITSNSRDRKNDIPSPEVSDSALLIENEKNEAKTPKLPPTVVIGMVRKQSTAPIPIIIQQRRRRSIWLALSGLLLLLILLLGSLCLYKNLLDKAHFEKQTFFCGVRFHETVANENDFELMARSERQRWNELRRQQHEMKERFDERVRESQMFAKQLMKDLMGAGDKMGEFEQGVELGEDFDYEKIMVPTIGDTRRATILHDFNINYTAIIDKEQGVCFLLPLNRSLVLPPKDFWDLLLKLKNGYYVPDTNVVKERYRVLMPALRDFTDFGTYIAHECQLFDTYKLAREGDPIAMAKRNACRFAGSNYCLGDAGSDKMLCFAIKGCI